MSLELSFSNLAVLLCSSRKRFLRHKKFNCWEGDMSSDAMDEDDGASSDMENSYALDLAEEWMNWRVTKRQKRR